MFLKKLKKLFKKKKKKSVFFEIPATKRNKLIHGSESMLKFVEKRREILRKGGEDILEPSEIILRDPETGELI